jgi:hypothetical protein
VVHHIHSGVALAAATTRTPRATPSASPTMPTARRRVATSCEVRATPVAKAAVSSAMAPPVAQDVAASMPPTVWPTPIATAKATWVV